MNEVPNKTIKLHEGQHRRLGYAQEFKQMVAERPGILKTALELTKQAENDYNPGTITVSETWNGIVEPYFIVKWDKNEDNWRVIKRNTREGWIDVDMDINEIIPFSRGTYLKAGECVVDPKSGLQITVLGKSTRLTGDPLTGRVMGRDKTTYFKVLLEGNAFFVKKSYATVNPGFEEFRNTNQVKEILKEIDNLEVVEAKLGYADSHQSWFVSKWEDLENAGFFAISTLYAGTPDDYGIYPPEEIRETKYNHFEKVEGMRREIQKRLKSTGINYADIHQNLFYNPDLDRYFYLDITALDPNASIGQEDLKL